MLFDVFYFVCILFFVIFLKMFFVLFNVMFFVFLKSLE